MPQIRLFFFCLLAIACNSNTCFAQRNALSTKESRDGWELLFDGESLDQWRTYRRPGLSNGWKVIDGEIRWVRKKAGDLISRQTFSSFELKLDYKIARGGNSGLMYHVTEDMPRPWQTGPEVQIQDNARGHDPQKAGWLYQLYPSDVDATRPAGRWNTLHIVITPEKCEQYVNGVRYCQYVKGSPDWNQKVAKSKFSKMPLFGKANNGHICLQDHGNEVAFRNIKIRRIVPETPPNN